MIVGKKDIDLIELNKSISEDRLQEYIMSLIPPIVRNSEEILNNQKYLVALYIRKYIDINFYMKQEICNTLLKDIELFGVINEVYDINDIISSCNISELLKYAFKEELSW